MTHPIDRNKMDRRIQRTRQSLRAALLELMKTRSYDDILIEEITEHANVGRATFYLHYKDKEDLLLEEFSEMTIAKAQALSEIPFSAWMPSQDEASTALENKPALPLLMVFQHIHDNSELYYILLKSARSSRIVERIRKISTEAITKFVETKLNTDPIPIFVGIPIEFLASFFSGALLSSVNWWLDEEMRHTPEEMTYMFQSLFFRGARKTIGLQADSDVK